MEIQESGDHKKEKPAEEEEKDSQKLSKKNKIWKHFMKWMKSCRKTYGKPRLN